MDIIDDSQGSRDELRDSLIDGGMVGPTEITGEELVPVPPSGNRLPNLTRASHFVKPSGPEETNKEPTTHDVFAGKSTFPKDSLTEAGRVGSTKLPAIAEVLDRTQNAVLQLLRDAGITSIVELKRENPFAILKQLRITESILNKAEVFDTLMNKKEDASAGFGGPNQIAFHILSVVCLIAGTNSSKKCLQEVIDLWKRFKASTMVLCGDDRHLFDEVVLKTVVKHASSSHRAYHVLLQLTKSPGMCKDRAASIMAWVGKLERIARRIFETIRKDAMEMALRAALMFKADENQSTDDETQAENSETNFFE